MSQTKSKNFSKIFSLIIAILLCFSSLLFVGCGEEKKVGISLSSPFRTTYVKDEEIEVNGNKSTNNPDFTGGEIVYSYRQNGEWKTRYINLLEAYQNHLNALTTGKLDEVDRVKVEGFSTNVTDSSKSYQEKEMRIIFFPKDDTKDFASNYERITIKYRVYIGTEELAGAQNVTIILNSINNVLKNIVSPILGVICAAAMIFAIILGFKLARANNAEERDNVKKQVIYTIVGIVIGVGLIILFQLFASSSLVWLGGDEGAVEFFPRFFIK